MVSHVAAIVLAAFALVDVAYSLDCCPRLTTALGSHVGLPGSSLYNESTSYWAEQQETLLPSCVVRPTNAHDVSSALVILVEGSCYFAVRGGGHSSTKGASNINGGVTIDMRGLNSTTLNDDNSLATIGAGQIWGGAYSALHEVGVTIPGGRDNAIGVAGSILGGALGYIAPDAGFGADSVVEFEVVLADGRIVIASECSNSDLWRALKGGGSNFGILTKLVAKTTPLGDIWTSTAVYNASTRTSIIQAFYDFASDPDYDPKANLLMTYHYSTTDGIEFSNQFTYAEPIVKPAVFDDFYSLDGQIANISEVTNIAAYSVEQDGTSPDGLWQLTFSTSFKNSVKQLEDLWTLFIDSLSDVDVDGISWSLTLEPIPTTLAAATAERGGNILGLDVPPEGIILTLGSFTFASEELYNAKDSAVQKLLSDIIALSKSNDVFNSWIDLNHAYRSQNPFKSYGDENYDFLKATAEKYDPNGVFQTLMPGGFKL
ncbi:hypothetical protein GGR51DRAFT_497199 [Nemania sp. FL0031]|nr:hypothetical protein GGR51DRAFT_497199 [Nemania sp. FL0031]